MEQTASSWQICREQARFPYCLSSEIKTLLTPGVGQAGTLSVFQKQQHVHSGKKSWAVRGRCTVQTKLRNRE